MDRPERGAVELVVARYRERIHWCRNVPRSLRVSLYDKGHDGLPGGAPLGAPAERAGGRVKGPPIEVTRLENVGFEAHSYLHHIVTRYETLSPLTIFCQGHPFDHAHDLHAFLRGVVAGSEPVESFRWLGFIIDSDDPRGRRLFVPWRKNADGRELDLDGFCWRLFGAAAKPWSHFYVGAQFAVTRAQIRVRSRAFYERALELAVDFPDGGACFERVWDRVFDVVGVDPALLDGNLCRYLKPIRRLGEPAEGARLSWHRDDAQRDDAQRDDASGEEASGEEASGEEGT